MNILIFVLLCVSAGAAPHFPFYSVYLPPLVQYDYLPPRPTVFAPAAPPTRRRVATPAATVSPLIHNTVTFTLDPDADPDDALEVAQFHSQDAAGRVVFGFNTPDQSRMEARSLDGSVRGSYSYQDPTGKTVKMHYWDNGSGFHTVGNTLPATYFTSPQYTPEVQAARERHFQLFRQALAAALSPIPEDFDVESRPINSETVEEDAASSEITAEQTADENRPSADQSANDSKGNEQDYDSDSDAVAIENPDFSSLRLRPAQRRGDPEASRKQVAEATDLTLDLGSNLAIARTGADGYQYLVPIPDPTQGHSESLHASLYGAIPVAAVHDAQVSPAQRENIDNHQLKPVLVRTGLAKSS